jgi:hypothetical protein
MARGTRGNVVRLLKLQQINLVEFDDCVNPAQRNIVCVCVCVCVCV